MSDLKVVDSHFHVWNLDTQSLPWLDGTDGTITHTYKVEDLEAEYARQAGVEFVGGVGSFTKTNTASMMASTMAITM